MATAKAVTDATFADEVLRSTTPTVAYFWAEWCTSCHRVGTMITNLAATDFATSASFVKVDIDANPKIANQYKIMTVPTVIVFRGGEPVGSITGARPKADLVKLIDSALV